MRGFVYIWVPVIISAIMGCAKQPDYSETPQLGYVDLALRQVYRENQARDTCDLRISFSDADGDLFVRSSADPSNVLLRYYIYHVDSAKFIMSGVESKSIKEPANGYYSGKAISGEIQIPLTQFRPNTSFKIIKMDVQMVDLKNHKSNIVSTPIFTLNF